MLAWKKKKKKKDRVKKWCNPTTFLSLLKPFVIGLLKPSGLLKPFSRKSWVVKLFTNSVSSSPGFFPRCSGLFFPVHFPCLIPFPLSSIPFLNLILFLILFGNFFVFSVLHVLFVFLPLFQQTESTKKKGHFLPVKFCHSILTKISTASGIALLLRWLPWTEEAAMFKLPSSSKPVCPSSPFPRTVLFRGDVLSSPDGCSRPWGLRASARGCGTPPQGQGCRDGTHSCGLRHRLWTPANHLSWVTPLSHPAWNGGPARRS